MADNQSPHPPRPIVNSVDEYIELFEGNIKQALVSMREIVKAELPDALETIGYAIPAYKVNNKPVVYFAGYAKHVGLYPLPHGDDQLTQDIQPYVAGKGTLRFAIDRPLPKELIARVARQRYREITNN